MKKLTKEYIESLVVSTEYIHSERTTICRLTPKNGFEIIAYSGTITPESFDKEIGEKISYNNALDILWAHESYLVTEKDYRGKQYYNDLKFFADNQTDHSNKFMKVGVPDNTSNLIVSLDNHLTGEVTHKLNVRYINYPLPFGPWKIYNIDNNKVTLIRDEKAN